MKKIYAVRDVVAEAVGPLLSLAGDSAAIRTFGDVASDPQTNVNRHVADYELICCGDVHDDGRIEANEYPRVVITGVQWKAAQTPDEVSSNVA